MTQQEFETRTGLNVSATEFDYIHRVYMATNFQKDDFCKEWKANHTLRSSNIVCDLMMQKEASDRVAEANHEALSNALKMQDELAKFIADMAHLAFSARSNGKELRRKAVEVLGKHEYLKYVITKGYELEQYDREDLLNILSE